MTWASVSRPAAVAMIVLVGLALILLASARQGDPDLYPPRPGLPTVEVFLVHNRIHSGLALPSRLWRGRDGPAAMAVAELRPTPWVLVGWGDARFFQGQGWSRRRVQEALDAILPPPNPAVLRLTPLPRAPDAATGESVMRLVLSRPGADRLLERLDQSFLQRSGRPVDATLPPAPQDGARFYASAERFGPPKLCNSWVGELLASAGLPTTPVLHLLPQGLALDLRLRAARQMPMATPANATHRSWSRQGRRP
jgi:hypothetical protein